MAGNSWARQLVVTVSVEPDDPRVTGQSVSYQSLKGFEYFQEMCSRFGVRPTYLLTYSAAREAACIDFARSCAGKSEFGAHLHPEEVPPIADGELGNYTLRPSDVDPEKLRDKIMRLIDCVTLAIGKQPTSYRAGFLDLTPSQVAILAELGIEADSSLGPLEKIKNNYLCLHAPRSPYILDDHSVCRQGESGVVEVPLTSVFRRYFTIGLFKLFLKQPLRVQRLFYKLKMIEILRFRPTMATGEELVTVCKRTEKIGAPAVMVIHSNELTPGTSTTVLNKDAHIEYFGRLEHLFRYTHSKNWRSKTLTEVAREVKSRKEDMI